MLHRRASRLAAALFGVTVLLSLATTSAFNATDCWRYHAADGHTVICADAGVCRDDGTCQCNFQRYEADGKHWSAVAAPTCVHSLRDGNPQFFDTMQYYVLSELLVMLFFCVYGIVRLIAMRRFKRNLQTMAFAGISVYTRSV